jgi:hypothetical protein
MAEAVMIIKENLYFAWLALIIFFAGFCFSYPVNHFKIKILLWFPKKFMKLMAKFINPKASFARIFLIIFLFNSISIFLYMLSGLFVILPFIITFLTGMNIGLTVFIPPKSAGMGFDIREVHIVKNMFLMMIFSTLVIVLEILVFSVALGMGMSIALAVSNMSNAGPAAVDGAAVFIAELLSIRLHAYISICVPVLAISAFMEASIIKGI